MLVSFITDAVVVAFLTDRVCFSIGSINSEVDSILFSSDPSFASNVRYLFSTCSIYKDNRVRGKCDHF